MQFSLERNSNRHDLSRIFNFPFSSEMIVLLVIRSSEAVIAFSLDFNASEDLFGFGSTPGFPPTMNDRHYHRQVDHYR
jgi:hypothetical protein